MRLAKFIKKKGLFKSEAENPVLSNLMSSASGASLKLIRGGRKEGLVGGRRRSHDLAKSK